MHSLRANISSISTNSYKNIKLYEIQLNPVLSFIHFKILKLNILLLSFYLHTKSYDVKCISLIYKVTFVSSKIILTIIMIYWLKSFQKKYTFYKYLIMWLTKKKNHISWYHNTEINIQDEMVFNKNFQLFYFVI